MSIHELVNIRELQLSDLNFLLSSSLQCLIQYNDTTYKGWNKQDLYKHLEKTILFGLNKCNYSVFIACDANDSDHIIAYIAGNHKTNHIFMQYTKYAYRKLGIQKNMLLPLLIDPDTPATVNWNTKEMRKLVKLSKISIVDKFLDEVLHLHAKKIE